MKKILITGVLVLQMAVCFAKTEVKVDPAIELINIVQLLADRTYFTQSEYSDQALTYFTPFKNHPAIKTLEQKLSGGGSWAVGPGIGSRLNWDANLSMKYPFTTATIELFGNETQLKQFIKNLNDFRKKSNYQRFIEQQDSLYKANIDKVQQLLTGETDYIRQYEKYMGIADGNYTFVISFLTPCGGVSPLNEIPGKKMSVIGICGYSKEAGFSFNKNSLRSLAWHEFNHPEIGPLVDQHKMALENSEVLYGKLKHRLKWADGLTSWDGVVEEHIIRAIVTRLLELNIGPEAAKREIQTQDGLFAFEYIHPLIEALKEYEANRNQYPTLRSYFPKLIEVFSALSSQLKPYASPIFRIRYSFPTVFVIPTAEKGELDTDSIRRSVGNMIDENSLYNSFIVTDKEALKLDAVFNFVAIGTMEGNLYLKALKDRLPFQLTGEGITGLLNHRGENLGLITAIPHPDNPEKALVINTAQQNNNLYLGSIMSGYDFMITQEASPNTFKGVKSGFFKRDEKGYPIGAKE